MDKITKMLDDRIEKQIEGINELDLASLEQGNAIDDLVKLYKLRIEESKNDADIIEKREARLMELDEKIISRNMESEREALSKKLLASEQTRDRYVKIGVASAEIILPLVFYAAWMNKGFQFEETGAFTSTTFKGLIGKFKPTKK